MDTVGFAHTAAFRGLGPDGSKKVPGASAPTCLYASGIPPLLLHKRMHRFASEHAARRRWQVDQYTPEPSGSGQRISTIRSIFKTFFSAQNRAGSRCGCEKLTPLVGASGAWLGCCDFKHLIQPPYDFGPYGLKPAADRVAHAVQKKVLGKSHTFTATQVFSSGFNSGKSVRELDASVRELRAPRSLGNCYASHSRTAHPCQRRLCIFDVICCNLSF
jgi:hypothetical protein